MATQAGEPLSQTVQGLMDMEEKYGAGTFGATPGFIVSGKGSTLIVSYYLTGSGVGRITVLTVHRCTRMWTAKKSSTSSAC